MEEVAKPRRNLGDILKQYSGQKHIIAIRGFPDPDSIGSAMAHAFIAQNYDIETIILYFDDISHQENRALVKKLAKKLAKSWPKDGQKAGPKRRDTRDGLRVLNPMTCLPATA